MCEIKYFERRIFIIIVTSDLKQILACPSEVVSIIDKNFDDLTKNPIKEKEN